MKIIKWTLTALIGLTLISLLISYVAYQQLEAELPDISVLRNVKYTQPLSIYSSDGLLIEQFGKKIRTPTTIDKIPKSLINAFISSEDGNFYNHSGVDFKGLFRAVIQLVLTGKKRQGGSTITMQVTRNFLLNNQKTYTRKLKEIILSFKIEQQFSKDEILELYLNKIYLGQRAYGIVAAANIYYDRPLTDLTLAEIGMIAGLPKAPSSYNPISNPSRALLRRNYVLKRMLTLEHISQHDYESAIQAPITAHTYTTQRELYAPYIAEMVRTKIVEQYGEELAYSAGFKVYTTLKSDLQNTAVNALRNNLHQYSERHSYYINNQQKQPLKQSRIIGATIPVSVQEISKTKITALTKDNEAVILNWDASPWSTKYNSQNKKTYKINSFMDIIELNDTIRIRKIDNKWRLAQLPQAESSFVALAPNNGAIIALSGGYAYFNNKYNRATQAKRQPGSGFKPIIYTTALEHGYTPASMINDAPIVNTTLEAQESNWRPENYSHKFYGPTSIRTALRKSRNLISVRLLRSVGIPAVTETALRFGFTQKQLPQKLSLALGSGAASPLQMARMYSVFANGGFLINPFFIERIESSTGETLFQADPQIACTDCAENNAPRIISKENNFLMNTLLRDVVRRGTAYKATKLGRTDLAGKTGTTNDQKDAWFNGFSPNLVGIAWVGKDNSQSLGRVETGSKAALPLWINFMRYALQAEAPEQELSIPEGIKKVLIEPEEGLLAREKSATSIWEYFTTETIPTQFSPIQLPITETTDTSIDSEQAAIPEVLF